MITHREVLIGGRRVQTAVISKVVVHEGGNIEGDIRLFFSSASFSSLGFFS